MEKAVLKTLAYGDIFDYPLKVQEIHKWLIGRKASLRQIEKALEKLVQRDKCKVLASRSGQSEYYFLPGRNRLVKKRQLREKNSSRFLWKARIMAWFLQIIPGIKLVGISGGLAMDNADKIDDIDLFIVTAKNRLWLSRFLTICFLDFLGVRRKAKMKISQVAGKLCVNILLEEDNLEQNHKDIYTAHEVLQMKVLWERDGMYQKYLMDNEWAFKFLPNWVGSSNRASRIMNYELWKRPEKHNSLFMLHDSILKTLENLAKRFQLWYMKSPKGMERIEDGALYFHPQDIRPQILSSYKRKFTLYKRKFTLYKEKVSK